MSHLTIPLEKTHKRDQFHCGEHSLDRYIKEQASQDMKRRLAVCFVVTGPDNSVHGFYTLSNSSIPKELMPEEFRGKLGYKDLPVTLLGRLAVDESQKGKGLGELLLLDALKRTLHVSQNQSASFAVVTDPLNENAEQFYAKYGFKKLEGNKRMFLMMKTIESLF